MNIVDFKLVVIYCYDVVIVMVKSEDFVEGFKVFVEKCKFNWKGR